MEAPRAPVPGTDLSWAVLLQARGSFLLCILSSVGKEGRQPLRLLPGTCLIKITLGMIFGPLLMVGKKKEKLWVQRGVGLTVVYLGMGANPAFWCEWGRTELNIRMTESISVLKHHSGPEQWDVLVTVVGVWRCFTNISMGCLHR